MVVSCVSFFNNTNCKQSLRNSKQLLGGCKIMKKILTAVVLAAMVAFVAPAFAASNPFADVPAGHWSYDAVALLASRGVVSGYPDGQYKGGQLATRYEMASIVARALVYVDEGKASKEDVELVQKLVAEFKNELEALGVKVADLDKRVAGLEKGLKGLRLKGIFWMDAEFGGTDNDTTQPKFEYHRARFFIEKVVDENTFFQMRVNFNTLDGKDAKAFKVDRLWFSTKLPWNIIGKFGYQTNDWDSEYGLYNEKFGGWGDEDSFWTNLRFMGFDFRKDFGKFDVDFYVARNTQNIDGYKDLGSFDSQSYMTYGLKLGYKSEKLKLGLFGRYAKWDGDKDNNSWHAKTVDDEGRSLLSLNGADILNYGVYANFKPIEGLQLKGTFNHQHFDGSPSIGFDEYEEAAFDDEDADAWTVVAEADQKLLKLFALWAQYGEVGSGFIHNEYGFDQIGYNSVLTNFGGGEGIALADYRFWKVAIHRDFTKKLKAYAMYMEIHDKGNEVDNTVNFGVGLKYQYTPAIAFQLQYDWRDYGNGITVEDHSFGLQGREDLFRFRTIISF